MKVDRHNYEEFFILYWDNELSASQKQAVENFVKENSDLQEEFKMLGDTRFIPDSNIQLREKDFFVNNSFINVTNYEEQLLNYIDDELTTDQNAEVEKAVANYPGIRKELSLLYKTKLQPESTIVFPDKSVLYRREERARVISMTWFRVAVAAAIILIAGLITFRIATTDNGGDKTEVAINKSDNNSTPLTTKPADKPAKENQGNTSSSLVKQTKKQKSTPVQPVIDNKDQQPVKDKADNVIAYKEDNKNNLPKEGSRVDLLNSGTPADLANTDRPDFEKKQFGSAQKNTSDIVNTSLGKDDVTLQVKPTLYIPEAEEKEKDGGGIKEFLRKTTRVFERRTKIQTTTEDNKLLVGAFAVSLK